MSKITQFFAALATIVGTVIAVLVYTQHQAPQPPAISDPAAPSPIVSTVDSSPRSRELVQALRAAVAIQGTDNRDLALQHVVRASLYGGAFAIAIAAGDSIASTSLHDEVLNYITNLAIAQNRFEEAREASQAIQSTSIHDAALARVAEAINNRRLPGNVRK